MLIPIIAALFLLSLVLCLWPERKPLVCVWCNKTLTGKSRFWCHDCHGEWTK